jgi:hypothetical protein
MSPRDERFDDGRQSSAMEERAGHSARWAAVPPAVDAPDLTPPGGSPREPVLVWIICDSELLEAHAVERDAAGAFMLERMSLLSDDQVTRSVDADRWSVVYRGRIKTRRLGHLQAYEVPFVPGTVEIREYLEHCPRVTFGSDLTGQVWTRAVSGFQRLHDGQWDHVDRGRWLAWAGFAPAGGTAWEFTQKKDGTLVASAWAGVVRLELTS